MADEIFSLTTRIARPAAEVLAWHEQPGALARLCPPWERIEVLSSSGGIRDGAHVHLRARVGPGWSSWQVEHRDYIPGVQFRDVQISGPFTRWEHLHRFQADGAGACLLSDTITYRLPGGAMGGAIAGGHVRAKLARLFAWRHAVTASDLEIQPQRPRHVLIAGASGLVGAALVPFLTTQGHRVTQLVRRTARAADELAWNPGASEIDVAALEGVDAIVNLSGENVAAGRWTAARCERIMRSRVDATRTLVQAIRGMKRKPDVLVNASAVGFYGERGDEELTEASGIGHGFLPEVCLAWETHAEGADRAGVRTALLRFGIVLTPKGGALARLLPVFKCGGGGRLGSGAQWMSWISIDDAVGAIHHAVVNPALHGAVNTVSTQPVTNADFTQTLGRVLCRPTLVAVPATVLRLAFGAMADEALLASQRAKPARLIESGYRFRQPTLEHALRHVLGRA